MAEDGPRKPRVLLVATHPIQYQAPLFRALARCGELDFSVLFVQLPDAAQQGMGFNVPFEWDIPLLEGYEWHQVPQLHGRGGLRGFFSTRIHRAGKLLHSLKPDVVILTGWQAWPLWQMLIAARLAGLPVVMRGESNALRRRPLSAQVLHRMLLSCCTAFLTIGKANRQFYAGYGIDASAMFNTAYFVDNTRFMNAAIALAPQRGQLRTRWNIPPDAVCFGYAGKLEPKKRVLDLLAALRMAVASSAVPLHLLVVGTGELMRQAQAYVVEHGLPVTFTGFLNQTEIPAAYVAIDCLVLPSDYGETWGLVVNEAMACGRPALVSDRVGCGPDLIVNDETGAVFPFGDVDALADALVTMASNPERLQVMGARARAHVLNGYTVENAVHGTLAAVRHVLSAA